MSVWQGIALSQSCTMNMWNVYVTAWKVSCIWWLYPCSYPTEVMLSWRLSPCQFVKGICAYTGGLRRCTWPAAGWFDWRSSPVRTFRKKEAAVYKCKLTSTCARSFLQYFYWSFAVSSCKKNQSFNRVGYRRQAPALSFPAPTGRAVRGWVALPHLAHWRRTTPCQQNSSVQ